MLSLHIIDLWLLNKFNGSCNTLSKISIKICVPSKTENINLNVIILITELNESKTLTKHISYKCKCKLDSKSLIQIEFSKTINVNVSVKYIIITKKIIVGILLNVMVKMANIQEVLLRVH